MKLPFDASLITNEPDFATLLGKPMSRRGTLGALAGATGAALLPSPLDAEDRRRRPHGPGRHRGLGDSDTGIVRWKQPAFVPVNVAGALHYNGIAFVTSNLNGESGVFTATDTSGMRPQSISLDSGQFVGDLVILPAFQAVIAMTQDGHNFKGFDTRTSPPTPFSGSLDWQAVSNLVSVNDNMLVYMGQGGYLIGKTFTSPSGSIGTFEANLGVNKNQAVIQAISGNSFFVIWPEQGGQSMACYANAAGPIAGPFEAEFATGPFVAAYPYFYYLADDGAYWSAIWCCTTAASISPRTISSFIRWTWTPPLWGRRWKPRAPMRLSFFYSTAPPTIAPQAAGLTVLSWRAADPAP